MNTAGDIDTRRPTDRNVSFSPAEVRFADDTSTNAASYNSASCWNPSADLNQFSCSISSSSASLGIGADLRMGAHGALRAQNGIQLTDVRGAGDNSTVRRYGAWMEDVGFYMYTGLTPEVTQDFLTAGTVLAAGQTFIVLDTVGDVWDDEPNDAGTYQGAMVGTPVFGQQGHGQVLVGDATLVYETENFTIQVDFTDIFNVDTGMAHTDTAISFADLNLEEAVGSIRGANDDRDKFYGIWYGDTDAHEAAGIFNYENVMGVWGVKRVAEDE